MNYYIADCHFGDEKVIRFSHRPFETVEEMDRTMIENWNARIYPWDDVYILGDLIARSDRPRDYLEQLKGRLHLIRGNHDAAIAASPDLSSFFVEICDYLVVHDETHRLVLFHYPLLEWDGFYYGTWHVFGHIHNHPSLTQSRVRLLPKALNCGVDITGFRPLRFDELVTCNKKDGDRMRRPEGAV